MSRAHLVHAIPGHGEVLCDENGIAEPLTAHIFNVLASEWRTVDGWIETAIARNDLHLLGRVRVALLMVRGLDNEERANWARDTMLTKIAPAYGALLEGALGRGTNPGAGN